MTTQAATPVATALPPIGLGTWPLVGADATKSVLSGIEAGYRLIDTAAIYGNEDAVGVALAESALPREELFVTTKLRGNDQVSGDIRGALEQSLERLGLDQLDLFLIHWPLPRIDRYVASFEAMLACRDAGLVRYVGVSNFLEHHLRRVVAETGEAPAVNQIQMDPSLARIPVRRANEELGIFTQSWSPLGRGDVLDNAVVGGRSPVESVAHQLKWSSHGTSRRVWFRSRDQRTRRVRPRTWQHSTSPYPARTSKH